MALRGAQSLTEYASDPEVDVAPGHKRPRVRDSFFLWFEEGVPRGAASLADDPVADIIKEQIWFNPLMLYQQALGVRFQLTRNSIWVCSHSFYFLLSMR